MRHYILPILILFCIILGVVYLLANTPFFINTFLPDIINRHQEYVQIEYLRCARQKVRLPDLLSVRDVNMRLRHGQRIVTISAGMVTIHNFFDFIKKPELLYISGDQVKVSMDNIEADGLQIKAALGLSDWTITSLEGSVFSRIFIAGPYAFEKISAYVTGDTKKTEFADIKGSFYDGDVVGKVTLDYQPQPGYVVWAEFIGLRPQNVRSPYADFFQAMDGLISGSARVVGSDQVDIFTVILEAQPGLTVSPDAFLKMKGAFTVEEEAALRRLSQQNSVVTVEQGTLHMQNSRQQRIMFVFDIVETDRQLVLKGRYPLAWEADFESFLFPVVKSSEVQQ